MYTKSNLPSDMHLPAQTDNKAQNSTMAIAINHNAPVKCSKSILIAANSQKVWTLLTDINHWANWQTEISKPKLNGELLPGTSFDWQTGGAKIHSTLHTVVANNQFGWTGTTIGMYAIHNWKITEMNGHTLVEVEESISGLLAKLFKKSFNKNLEKGMTNWLNLLKDTCES